MRRAAETTAESSIAVGLLYERYSERILAYCLHALRHRTEAEDAVQTTFLQAHRALRRGVTPEHEFAWLHTIAKNVCRTHQRTAARRAAVTGVDLDVYPAMGDAADERELRRALCDALASLPEAQRRALVMREWQGLSSAEVASRMGMSAPATYALLTRARRSLADALTTVRGRAALGANVWPLFARLKALLAGGAAKVATAIAIGAAVAAGGATTQLALADRPNGPSREIQRVQERTTTRSVAARVDRRSGETTSETRRSPALREVAPRSRVGTAPAYVPERPDDADAPTPALPGAEPDAQAEPASEPDTPPPVEAGLETALDAVPELPLPEVDLEIPILTEVVPDEPLPPVEGLDLPELPPVQVPPLPPLP
jgi:RNA polymerase sigma factor (sigma-70 family)